MASLRFPEAQRPLFAKLVAMTVEVRKRSEDGEGCGSGVVLTADGLIITAYHVITRARVVRVHRLRLERRRWKVWRYGTLTADVIFRDRKADIAVLKLRKPPKDLVAAEIEDQEVEEAEALYRVGRDDVPLATGHLLRHGFDKRIRELEISMSCGPGSSGGPVFDENGKLVGIVLRYQSVEKLPPKAHALPISVLRTRILSKPKVKAHLPPD